MRGLVFLIVFAWALPAYSGMKPGKSADKIKLTGFIKKSAAKQEIVIDTGRMVYTLRRPPVFLANQAALKNPKPNRQVRLKVSPADVIAVNISTLPAKRVGAR